MSRTILHVDMDAFFVSVELLRHPELRGRPVAVGGTGNRGVVAAASYEARSFGVHSALPSVRAKRLCPQLVFLAGDHGHYAEVSARVMELFRAVTPFVEPLSLDEAFLDVSGARRLLGSGPDIAVRLRSTVLEFEGLSASVGVAPNKFLAKLASVAAKPRPSAAGPVEGSGVAVVDPGAELEFLHPLPVQALWGVGPATLAKLARFGVVTVGDLARVPTDALVGALGTSVGTHLHELSWGRDDRAVVPDQEPKSVSNEVTFPRDLVDRGQLRSELVGLADSVASRLRHHGFRGRTVQIKVRFPDFTTITRSHTLVGSTDRPTDLVDRAWAMLERLPVERGVRLLGVGVSNLSREPDSRQLSLSGVLDDARTASTERDAAPGSGAGVPDEDWDAANEAVDAIRSRFGRSSIGPARLVGRGERPISQPWGPDEAPPSP